MRDKYESTNSCVSQALHLKLEALKHKFQNTNCSYRQLVMWCPSDRSWGTVKYWNKHFESSHYFPCQYYKSIHGHKQKEQISIPFCWEMSIAVTQFNRYRNSAWVTAEHASIFTCFMVSFHSAINQSIMLWHDIIS